METDLETIICELLVIEKDSEKLKLVMNTLNKLGVRSKRDLKYVTADNFNGVLTKEEVDKISHRTFTIREAVEEILSHVNQSRIEKVTKILESGGAGSAEDLKYFDWNSLNELGGLTEMEVEKVMRYLKSKFPEEYEEHRNKRKEELKLKRETELADFKVKALIGGEVNPGNADQERRNGVLNFMQYLRNESTRLRKEETSLSMESLLFRRENLSPFVGFCCFFIFFIILISCGWSMHTALLVILSTITTVLGLYVVAKLYGLVHEWNHRKEKLERLHGSIREIEYQLHEKQRELDLIDIFN